MGDYTSIELFAGAGGLALGLEQAGFRHLGLIEKDKDAAATLKLNRPNWNVLCEDIAAVTQRDLEKEFGIKKGELDLLSGGAPCQSFSTVGKKLGLEDTRGTMFYHYAEFLYRLAPKMFLFENVKGLLTHDHGKTYATILRVFEDAGYSVVKAVLNAWDFDAPQKRERLFTVGVRKDFADIGLFSFPTPHEYKPVIGDVKLDINPSKEECAHYSANKRRIMELVPPGGCWQDIPLDIAKEYMLIRNLLIEKEYVVFLVGRDGEFDQLVTSTIRHEWADGWGKANSEMNWVQAYPNAVYTHNIDSFDSYYSNVEVCPESSNAHPKSAIQIRNQNMVDRSDLVVFYVERNQGGAFQTMRYALKKGKKLVNLAEEG